MTKERIPISGDLKSKVKQLLEYAGWQEGRKVDISIAEKYYADHGVPMMKTTQRFYRKYFGLCCDHRCRALREAAGGGISCKRFRRP